MGDTIEFTTQARHQSLFYEVTSNTVNFELHPPQYALVGLATTPSACDYWVVIGDYDKCWIKKEQEKDKIPESAVLENIDDTIYQRFWIKWHSGLISLGRGGESKPIVTLHSDACDREKIQCLKYVTFGVLNEETSINWRLQLSPLLPLRQVKYKEISDGKLRWVEMKDFELPEDALIGGFENEVLYIARARHNHSLTPGKFVPSKRKAYVAWGGASHATDTFEVLCGYDCIWVATSGDNIPANAFIAGHSEVRGENLYVTRAEHNGHIIPGKVHPYYRTCYIPFEGKEIEKHMYEILVEPTYVRSANVNYATLRSAIDGIGLHDFRDNHDDDEEDEEDDDDDDEEDSDDEDFDYRIV